MKPPPRKRVKTSRELLPVPQNRSKLPCKWPWQEQMKLVTALIKLSPKDAVGLAGGGEPLLLDLARVKESLPSRTIGEITSVLENLKQKLWIREASAVSRHTEECLSSAFSQLLTVASTEPCSVKSSSASQQRSSSSPQRKAQTPSAPVPAPDLPVRTVPLNSSMCEVNFEKIYLYLSTLHKPSEKQCQLTPMESAVLLDLLMSLPEELLLLDCDPIVRHLSQMYPLLLSGDESDRTEAKTGKNQSSTAPPTQTAYNRTTQHREHSIRTYKTTPASSNRTHTSSNRTNTCQTSSNRTPRLPPTALTHPHPTAPTPPSTALTHVKLPPNRTHASSNRTNACPTSSNRTHASSTALTHVQPPPTALTLVNFLQPHHASSNRTNACPTSSNRTHASFNRTNLSTSSNRTYASSNRTNASSNRITHVQPPPTAPMLLQPH
ncbi:hypothetical protein WMY93_014019 [Mugilogobius chulae]|uniref:Uncharacterized protein n=1 Tax=Mugilogobius chulae TaxID=88201 RepID=A0AAW0P5F2_9GOBI